MKKLALLLFVCASVSPAFGTEPLDSVPARAVVVTGDAANPEHLLTIAELYSRENMAFQDPSAPRFLFLDKKGQVALGIGGYLKATAMYDMDGAINSNGFSTYDIPVPLNPAQRQRFAATANHSTIFLKLVTHKTRLGRVIVYMQSNFTGDNGGYGFKMSQAYLSVGNLTLGKTRTTFADGPAMAPTVDDEGNSGQVSAKNMLIRYSSPSYRGFSYAVSVEVPSISITNTSSTASISQRVPDIPAYIQYAWDKGNSHIRLSGIYRGISYRDTYTEQNHIKTGWGVQLSGVGTIAGGLGFFGHYTYGKGIASYINDLSGEGLDLIPTATSGDLTPAAVSGWTAGLQYTFNPKLFVSASYSQAHLFKASGLGGDTYRYGQYAVVNAFYEVWNDLQVGVEFVHGNRHNYDNLSGKANRVDAMLKYNF